jgi:cell division protein FtsL
VLSLIFSKYNIILIFLMASVLATAFSIVSVKDQNRRLVTELATLERARDELNVQWSQLLLEQNTWSAQARIQHIAQNNLGMGVPAVQKIAVVRR